ncbi:C6 transcription factor [Fusarium oxysporum f. sp. phaseoli]
MLKHKPYQLRYSNEPLVQSDIEVIRAIRELDDELENWRLTIPKFLRPASILFFILSTTISCAPLCLEASRSTLIHLQAAVDWLEADAFWRVIFYATAAMMTLFFHIFAKPSSPQAKADLELMSSTEKLIRNMPLPELTLRQTSHVQLLTKFVSDLVRLGDLAMLKARV